MVFSGNTFYLAEEAAPAETHTAADSTAKTEASSGGIGAIGVDGRSLLFQIINFVILLFILKKVAYKPILNMLETRRKRIEDSLQKAAEAEQAQAEAEATAAKVLAKARAEAEAIAVRSREESAALVRAAEAKASERAEQIEKDAHERVSREAQTVRAGLKKELAGLVADATKAVIDEKLDDKKDAALIQKALAGAERK